MIIKRDHSPVFEVLCSVVFLTIGIVGSVDRGEFISNGFDFYYSIAAVFMVEAIAIAIKRHTWYVKEKESILAGVTIGVFWIVTLLYDLIILKTDQMIVIFIDVIIATLGFIDAIYSFKKNRDFDS